MRVFHTQQLSDSDFTAILSALDRGDVIGYPTDTAYGLGADPFNAAAVHQIFRIKGRAETKPILLLVNSISMVERIARPPELFYSLARQYWPGPLTLVLPARTILPESVTAGTGTVALRWPVAAFALRLVGGRDAPLTATSANRSGMPSAVTVEEMQAQLGDRLPVMIDGGPLPHRGGSTLLDITRDTPVLLREGPIRFASLQGFLDGRIHLEL